MKTAAFAFVFGAALSFFGINVIDSPVEFFSLLVLVLLWVTFGRIGE